MVQWKIFWIEMLDSDADCTVDLPMASAAAAVAAATLLGACCCCASLLLLFISFTSSLEDGAVCSLDSRASILVEIQFVEN
jgi:hypothetical protein